MVIKKNNLDYSKLRDIQGYEGLYAITKNGMVWSYPKEWVIYNGGIARYKGKWLKLFKRHGNKNNTKTPKNFLAVTLSKDNRVRAINVHRLVASLFLYNKNKYRFVEHIDGCLMNNAVTNLRWVKRQKRLIKI